MAVTETASQHRKLQKTVEQTLLDLNEAVKIVPVKEISERMGEQFGVIETVQELEPGKVSRQETS